MLLGGGYRGRGREDREMREGGIKEGKGKGFDKEETEIEEEEGYKFIKEGWRKQ